MHDTKKPTPAPVPADLPDRDRWPATRRALVLTKQEQLDRELGALAPCDGCFDGAPAPGCPGKAGS